MTPLHIVLVSPEIPHNTGAIGRLCVCLDCCLHLIRPIGFHLDTEHIRRAGLDYWEYLRLEIHDNWSSFLNTVKVGNMFFLSTRGNKTLYDCRFESGDALIFGCESSGLPSTFYEEYASSLYKIPMPGENARSINLANAVSIATYEAYRQIFYT